jgi:cell division protein FtsZ
MKGARGLLISITGGKDLTLFEVDEAATRIREEVDQDANIIVGATFDESLDGLIRVSVVATGIEQAAIMRNSAASTAPAATLPAATTPHTSENRLADLTARLRADNARLADRAAKLESQAPASAPVPQRTSNSVERAALAAIAAAVAPDAPPATPPQQVYGDVTVRPIVQKPSLFPDPERARAEPAEAPIAPETFIPQAAERPAARSPRMPKFEELPMPAQAEIRQARGDAEEEHPQKSRLSLLQRLANVGLGRRDEENEPPIAARASGPVMPSMPPLPERKPAKRSVQEQIATTEPVSEYARRPAPQGLDHHGRPAPVAPAPQGDDHLDIPAFLRRQAT